MPKNAEEYFADETKTALQVRRDEIKQLEAGLPREARCRVEVKIAGEQLAVSARTLVVGQPVRIEGFLTRSGFKGSEASIVIHATGLAITGDAGS